MSPAPPTPGATGATHFPHGIDTSVVSVAGVPVVANVGGSVVWAPDIPDTVEPGATHFQHGVEAGTNGHEILSLGGSAVTPNGVGATHFPDGIDLGV